MFSDNEPSYLSAHLSFSVINVKEDSFLMVHITHVPGKFLPRNNLHLLSSVCLCGLFHSGVIYCSAISLALISHSSDWDVIFFLHMSAPWKLEVFLAQHGTFPALPLIAFSFSFACVFTSSVFGKHALAVYIYLYKHFCSSFVLWLSNLQDTNTPDVKVYKTPTTAVTCWMDLKWNSRLGREHGYGWYLTRTWSSTMTVFSTQKLYLWLHTAPSVCIEWRIMKLHIWFLYKVKFIPLSPHRYQPHRFTPLWRDRSSKKYSFKRDI